MYNLTVSTLGKVLRTSAPVTASQALRDWFTEETTGYHVACHDESGVTFTKAQLRDVARQAGGLTAE